MATRSAVSKLIRQECCNYDRATGACIVADRPCVLIGDKDRKRCRWFERALLPLAKSPAPSDRPGLPALAMAAGREYWGIRKLSGEAVEERNCPDCGGPLAPRRRYCDQCAARRQRESKRRAARKRRRAGAAVDS